jgi:hypothetical protein
MSFATARLCARGHTVTGGGRCPSCDRRRGTAHARGYDRDWLTFRPHFLAQLVEAGVLPVCGAALPTGPHTTDSACQAAGLFTFTSADGSSLHLDHEPPLTDTERRNARAVCDVRRVQLLCVACHLAKTRRETSGGA